MKGGVKFEKRKGYDSIYALEKQPHPNMAHKPFRNGWD